MSINRPIGHIAGTLHVVAMQVAQRVNYTHGNGVLLCWLTDDGCLYAQAATQPAAQAVLRGAPDQVINRYRKQPQFGWQQILEDLEQARYDFAARHMAEATNEACAA